MKCSYEVLLGTLLRSRQHDSIVSNWFLLKWGRPIMNSCTLHWQMRNSLLQTGLPTTGLMTGVLQLSCSVPVCHLAVGTCCWWTYSSKQHHCQRWLQSLDSATGTSCRCYWCLLCSCSKWCILCSCSHATIAAAAAVSQASTNTRCYCYLKETRCCYSATFSAMPCICTRPWCCC